MFSKKKKEETKERIKEGAKEGHKSDKSDKEKHVGHSHSINDLATQSHHHHHKENRKSEKSKKGKESDKERVSTKASTSPKDSPASVSKSNKELKEHTSSKKFKKSSSAPSTFFFSLHFLLLLSYSLSLVVCPTFQLIGLVVIIPKKNDVGDSPAVVDDALYDFLCDPTNFDDGPKLKFKAKAASAKDTPLCQIKRTGSDKSTRSRQSSSRSMSFS